MSERDAKHPFDIDVALERIAEAVRPYPKAAMYELAETSFAKAEDFGIRVIAG